MPPATLTTACPAWYCRSPQPPCKPWRAARPARSPPAATLWPPHGTGPSSPGSGVWPSLPAGCCPWLGGRGPWAGADPGGASRRLDHAGWAFGLFHRCGGGSIGLLGKRRGLMWVSHQSFAFLKQSWFFSRFNPKHCGWTDVSVSYQSRRCCPCSSPDQKPERTGWSRGGASCECRRGLGPSPAPHTSPMQALVSEGLACAPGAR